MAMLLAGVAALAAYTIFPTPGGSHVAFRGEAGIVTIPNLSAMLDAEGQSTNYSQLPAPIVTATASATPTRAKHKTKAAAPVPSYSPTTSSPTTGSGPGSASSGTPLAGASYAGSMVSDETGSQLTSWNQTNTFCPEESWQVADGKVSTDAAGDATLSTTGATGSCVAIISPGTYSSAVIEADIDFPGLPGSSNTIADWTSFWMTDGSAWPQDGELDAVEAQPVNGENATSWHSGSSSDQFVASTDDFFPTKLPANGPNLTPGWHTVDIVYTAGFFAVYYDGQQYTTYNSGNVTGDPLNIYLTTSVTPDISSVQQSLGGPPVNSDNSPATLAVKYLKVWSFK
jgi:hypothetical protein